MNFGLYLKQLREGKDMSLRQLAMYSNVSHAYLSQVERGERGTPSPDILNKLAKPLCVGYEELMLAAGYLSNDTKSVPSPKSKRLISVIARADELPDENIEDIADTLSALIEIHKKRIMKKKNTPDTK